MDTFYFYDLETSGINPRESRIMQFAGQRTDLDLRPIGEPDNILVALTEDILPDPDAILITGITPQHTQAEGTTEADFLETFHQKIATPGTIFVGYNTVRFDDEFMRAINYRNFYDPYQWQWKDNRSRWDLLDVVRMTRALRPEGIKWPVTSDGKPTNRLELLTALNGLDHSNAHDALNDVLATISLAQLLRTNQPKLFDYLLQVRGKQAVQQLVNSNQPFVYSSGKYHNDAQKTAVVVMLAESPRGDGALVYDLRCDPTPFADMTPQQLAEAWAWQKPEDRTPDKPRLPIKTLKYNRCPAVAPLGVIKEDTEAQSRLKIDMATIATNRNKLKAISVWPERILQALEIMDKKQTERFASQKTDVDGQIYDGFMNDADTKIMEQIRSSDPDSLADFVPRCKDQRLKSLIPLYKARNFPRKLSPEERAAWEDYRAKRLLEGGQNSRLAKYFKRIEQLSQQPGLSAEKKYLLEDLNLYGQSIVPSDLEI